jgi:hypothetical protein
VVVTDRLAGWRRQLDNIGSLAVSHYTDVLFCFWPIVAALQGRSNWDNSVGQRAGRATPAHLCGRNRACDESFAGFISGDCQLPRAMIDLVRTAAVRRNALFRPCARDARHATFAER